MGLELKDMNCIVMGERGVLRCVTPVCPKSPHKAVLDDECIKRGRI